jgi:hypothetical protein
MLANYPVISSNLALNLGVFGTADPYNANQQNNGALNPLGSLYFLGAGEGGLQSNQYLSATASHGAGSGLWVKYVLFKSTDTTAVKTGPAPVYWTDETYTQVTDLQSEALYAGANSVAGWLLPNSTATTAFTMTALRNGGLGSYVFIGLQGFIAGCFVAASTATGDTQVGGTAAWTPIRVAAGTAPTSQPLGYALTAVATLLSDVVATMPIF